ncbi:MAG: type II secretion system protein GspC [Thermodesulfobacteriota bacterium]|nr:type II secretion system protein GspC [Thermodesulfobacteriota bacterium]
MILKRFSLLIKLVIITLTAWVTSDIFITIISSKLEVSPKAKIGNKLDKQANTHRHPLGYYSIITSKNIFNPKSKMSDSGNTNKPIPMQEEKQITELNIQLRGIITGDPKDSFAIIEDMDKRKQDIYRLNDDINGATVIEILKDKVVLLRNGQREALIMRPHEENKQRFKATKRKNPKAVERITSSRYVLSKESLNSTIGNLNEFMTQLKVTPHFESGKPEGFQISMIKPRSLIGDMGLRNGDIIKKINNITIDNPEQAIGVYQQLQNAESLTIEVQRGKRIKVFNYEIR